MYAETQTCWLTWTSGNAITASSLAPLVPLVQDYTNATTSGALTLNWVQWVSQQEETAEQRTARRQAHEVACQRQRDFEAVRKAAGERAERLLVACLSSQQRGQLQAQGWFTVQGRSGRVFQIRRGRVRNVVEIATRRTYCCHPVDGVPDADTMLCQKLMIETQEDEFLRLANVS